MLRILVGLCFVVAAGGCARSSTTTNQVRDTHVQAMDGASRASVRIQFGGGTLTLEALDDSADRVSAMSYEGPAALRPESTYRVRDGTGELAYVIGNADRQDTQADMRVRLARGLPLAVSVETGAAEATLDLTELYLTRLDLQVGSSSTRVRLPTGAGETTVKAEAGATRLTFEVPPGVAADIHVTGGLDRRNIDELRFPRLSADRYRSGDFETASNRIDLIIEIGVANLTVR